MSKIDKRILYETLYKAFYPQSIVAFATTNGYRMCVNDPQMVDYDVLYAIDANMESKTWMTIGNLNAVPHIVIKINDFYVVYDYGATIDSIEKGEFSYLGQPQNDQAWVRHVYTVITQAFIDAGYVAPTP
jgi:hypothetical protein